MAWVIGGIAVLALLIWFAGRRARHNKVYDQRTWERIGAHGVEMQGRGFSREHAPYR
jgi:hypothetical protein